MSGLGVKVPLVLTPASVVAPEYPTANSSMVSARRISESTASKDVAAESAAVPRPKLVCAVDPLANPRFVRAVAAAPRSLKLFAATNIPVVETAATCQALPL